MSATGVSVDQDPRHRRRLGTDQQRDQQLHSVRGLISIIITLDRAQSLYQQLSTRSESTLFHGVTEVSGAGGVGIHNAITQSHFVPSVFPLRVPTKRASFLFLFPL